MKTSAAPSLQLTLLLLILSAFSALAMPPHPDLVAQIADGQVAAPYYLQHREALEAQGIDQPQHTPNMRQIMEQHALDDNFRAIAILLDFTDRTSHTPATSFDNLLFGGQTGSLKDYITQVTYGQLTLVTVNMPSAMGWTRMPQSYAYYCNGQNGMGTYPHNTQKMAEDAVQLVDPVVDFSLYDNDGDGWVDALFFIHSGPGAEFTGSSSDIWSHQWGMNAQLLDGVYASTYSTEPEYWVTSGDMTCGVYAHEMGHAAFGLPDLYDYGYDSNGLGRWSLMAGGSWNGTLGASPANPDAFCRIKMGVLTSTLVSTNQIGASIPAVETSPTIFRINGTSSQYVLIENRQRTGYDASLVNSGLLIYHVDEAVYGNNSQWYPGHTTAGHYQVALEQADGLWNLEHNNNSGDSGDPYPGGTGNRTYNDASTPNSRDYNAASTGIGVQNISNSASVMTADLYASTPRTMVVTTPNGGESWFVSDADTIRWSSQNITGNVIIDLNRTYPAGTWTTIASSAANSGSYRWVVPAGLSTSARIRVRSVTYPAVGDTSDANFTLAQRSIAVTSPNTAVTWLVGDVNNITWSSQNISENVRIEINRSYSTGAWTAIAASVPNTGSYAWTVTGPASTTARIRVKGVTHTAVIGTSAANITVAARTLTVTSPNTAVTWVVGDDKYITWTSSNLSENVKIEMNRSYPAGSWETITAGTSNTGSFVWNVTSPVTATSRIRVVGLSHTAVGDTSNTNFGIGLQTITLTQPVGGEIAIIPGTDSIRWTSTNFSENVKIELNRDYPAGTWELLAAIAANNGLYRWNVIGQETSTARIRLSGVTHTTVGDTSAGDFSFVTGVLDVSVANEPGPFFVGDRLPIVLSDNLSENVKVELNRNFPTGAWTTLASRTRSDTTFYWTITGSATENARIRVSGVTHTGVRDSTGTLAFRLRVITLQSPNTALNWAVGDTDSIRWTSANLPGNIKIELKRAWSTGAWETLAAAAPNTGGYPWTVSGPVSSTARIRVTGCDYSAIGDTSNANFAIATRMVRVTAPNTATRCLIGGFDTLRWTSACMPESLSIQINRDYPSGNWTMLASPVPNTGSYLWLVSGPESSTARIRITGLTHTSIADTSDVNFAIANPSLTLTSPNGGELWLIGDIDSIRWSSVNLTENVKIELNRTFPAGTWTTLASSAPNNGLYRWSVTTGLTTSARVRVSAVTHTFVKDTSDSGFSIAARTITHTSPNTVIAWPIGSTQCITWASLNLNENVRIEINRSYSTGTWTTLAASVPDTGSYSWTVTGPATSTARIRVRGVVHTSIIGMSAANFRITAAGSPPGGEPSLTSAGEELIPTTMYLAPNYPNPFNPSTTIEFGLPVASQVKMEIFNLLGSRVALLNDGILGAGIHRISWSCPECAAGVYLVRLQAGPQTFNRRMILLK